MNIRYNNYVQNNSSNVSVINLTLTYEFSHEWRPLFVRRLMMLC